MLIPDMPELSRVIAAAVEIGLTDRHLANALRAVLTRAVEKPTRERHAKLAPQVIAAVKAQPGCLGVHVVKALKSRRTDTYKTLQELVRRGDVVKYGPKHRPRYKPAELQ